ncbi:acyl-CoA-binding protein [Topomyia yanbarensis]|uniref:acyl-CoA-binding protein n=1 Tax=Topomyia yanbarensis TaxID=2498891 RepID=UPI00273BCCAB|nr:acyl-CoA-binding protein [Topomyia yanbarensis]
MSTFEQAVENAKILKVTPPDADLLIIYGLYKQATVGDCNTAKPGMLDFKGKAKWEAWNGRKGMSQDEAKQAYVDKVAQLVEQYGLQ